MVNYSPAADRERHAQSMAGLTPAVPEAAAFVWTLQPSAHLSILTWTHHLSPQLLHPPTPFHVLPSIIHPSICPSPRLPPSIHHSLPPCIDSFIHLFHPCSCVTSTHPSTSRLHPILLSGKCWDPPPDCLHLKPLPHPSPFLWQPPPSQGRQPHCHANEAPSFQGRPFVPRVGGERGAQREGVVRCN